MESLREVFERVERRQKTLEIYTDDDTLADELETQFATRNVRIERHPSRPVGGRGFVVVRDATGRFQTAVGLSQLEAMVSPEIHPPWRLEETDTDMATLFDFLENTIFTSYSRRQLLVVTREIEERAWRTDSGTMYIGFQRSGAFNRQASVYNRFARERDVTIRIYVADEWTAETADAIRVISDTGGELGQFWFVLFDGGSSPQSASGLLAEERTPGRYYGFWTDDPERVETISGYLETTYG